MAAQQSVELFSQNERKCGDPGHAWNLRRDHQQPLANRNAAVSLALRSVVGDENLAAAEAPAGRRFAAGFKIGPRQRHRLGIGRHGEIRNADTKQTAAFQRRGRGLGGIGVRQREQQRDRDGRANRVEVAHELQLLDAEVLEPQFQFVKRVDLQPDDAFGAHAVLLV